MKRAAVVVALILAGCGGGDDEVVEPLSSPVDSVPATTASTTTSSPPSTTTTRPVATSTLPRPTTTTKRTTVEITREAELSVRNCVSAMEEVGLSAALSLDRGYEKADTAQQACEDALNQVKVDTVSMVDTPEGQLILLIAEQNVDASRARLGMALGDFTPEQAAQLTVSTLQWSSKVEALLG